ncbi:MAG: hypothetical protein AVDCRST_MAG79-2651 [uncultured Thermoleophilia bacterium]|jgi:hypothetical protein|uniref:Uncharacterized protein n=1 Tax=uncultured Thermoleophilia bacterium TaxID=1497501 RepID=A0A6J4UJD0_9ACTN|nr:MAG: hypothetical protein AVDCRST_MAG79-2651 [uncultured Thermoleophilia bacterium]
MATPEAPSFELDIQPLFNQRDQEAMLIQFDLWNVEDVRDFAPEILATLESGRMPCYGSWPDEQVQLFKRWMDGGMPE